MKMARPASLLFKRHLGDMYLSASSRIDAERELYLVSGNERMVHHSREITQHEEFVHAVERGVFETVFPMRLVEECRGHPVQHARFFFNRLPQFLNGCRIFFCTVEKGQMPAVRHSIDHTEITTARTDQGIRFRTGIAEEKER